MKKFFAKVSMSFNVMSSRLGASLPLKKGMVLTYSFLLLMVGGFAVVHKPKEQKEVKVGKIAVTEKVPVVASKPFSRTLAVSKSVEDFEEDLNNKDLPPTINRKVVTQKATPSSRPTSKTSRSSTTSSSRPTSKGTSRPLPPIPFFTF